jgi:uncharacterized membrane protein YidH (DUF202 family)
LIQEKNEIEMSDKTSELRQQAEKESDPRVDLAVERTELALDRTQLAWIRTVLGFLGSGIALDKGIDAVHKSRIESGDALIQNAHFIGLSLSVSGTIMMMITTWYFIYRSNQLAKMKGGKPYILHPGAFASCLIILLGLTISFLLWIS